MRRSCRRFDPDDGPVLRRRRLLLVTGVLGLLAVVLLVLAVRGEAPPDVGVSDPRDCQQAGCVLDELSVAALLSAQQQESPVANAVFAPPPGSAPAPAFTGRVQVDSTVLRTRPELEPARVTGRDARLFPEVTLRLLTVGDVLVPVERGQMLPGRSSGRADSYWHLIAEPGRVWHEEGDGRWSRAALPLTLVNNIENQAQQGLGLFVYDGEEVSGLRVQFVQQTTPYLIPEPFVAWGQADLSHRPAGVDLDRHRRVFLREDDDRLPTRAWSALSRRAPAADLGELAGSRTGRYASAALVLDDTLYHRVAGTPYGRYPYPLRMRFGVRSITKSVAALALLRIAQNHGAEVADLRISDYVELPDPGWSEVTFLDALNMATGMHGQGPLGPGGDFYTGYIDPTYDAWYLAHSTEDKLDEIRAHDAAYPWGPGRVARYRDQDFFVLAVALDNYLESVSGRDADVWTMLRSQVLAPIGIPDAPMIRTLEPGGVDRVPLLEAGYYPTLSDLATIAELYQDGGRHGGRQLLHRGLTREVFSSDGSLPQGPANSSPAGQYRYEMGFHHVPYVDAVTDRRYRIPMMYGYGGSTVLLLGRDKTAIRIAHATPGTAGANEVDPWALARAVNRLGPLGPQLSHAR